MPITMQNDPKQSSGSTRPKPPVKATEQKPEGKKPIFTDWASI
ncbi:hypothetical protein [Cognatishimia activa]|nr:hypothetical protein [Cognatishimia activa]